MRTMRDTTPMKIGCHDPMRNIFYINLSDGRDFVMYQPRKKDRGGQKKAWKQISDDNKRRYRRANYMDVGLYDMNERCKFPLYKGEVPGMMPLSVEVDERIVGFCDFFFRYGEDFPNFNVDPEDKIGNASIVALDKYQGIGVGHYFSLLTEFIARHYECQWILGVTFPTGGTWRIRRKHGWETIGRQGKIIYHRKRL